MLLFWKCLDCNKTFSYDTIDGPSKRYYQEKNHYKTKKHLKNQQKKKLEDLKSKGCDCLNPEPVNGCALVSNSCPVHNLKPKPIEG
jgi:hypothetical protein